MKKLFLAFLLLPALARGQSSLSIPVAWALDADASYTYYTSTGAPASNATNVASSAIPVSKLVATSGSSTTITSVNTDAPFTGMAVGDILIFNISGVITVRAIATYTSANVVVVDTALTIAATGLPFQWRDRTSGTTAEAGWFNVAQFKAINILLNIPALDATSIDFRVECRGIGPTPVLVDTTSATSTGMYSRQINLEYWPFRECRVGIKATVDAGTQAINFSLSKVDLD